MSENAKLNKEEVLFATIDLLGSIDVPVRLKQQITEKIEGAIYNLNLVIVMIQKEAEVNSAEKTELNDETDDVNNLDFGGNDDDGTNDTAGRKDTRKSTESGKRHNKAK